VVYPNNFENKLGFDRIREMLKELCLGASGKEKMDDIQFSSDFAEIGRLIHQTDEFRQICLLDDDFPVSYFFDLIPCLKKARIEGVWMAESELFDLRRSLETIKSILAFFKTKKEEGKYPHLSELANDVKTYPFVTDKINTIINQHGKIRDNASPELANIRRSISQKIAVVSKRMQSILKQAQNDGLVESDVTLSMREGRLVIPINSSNKRKIRGFVHDESATGKTSYIEPEEIVETNNEIKELEYSERREIVKILTEFTDAIRPYLPDLVESYRFMGVIDFIRAKALFAIKIDAVKPAFFDSPEFNWLNARHPLLYLAHKKDGKTVVPLNIQLNSEKRVLVISGPNAGGKSVCLKTTGLLQYMFQCGLLVPLKETSEMGIFEQLFIDIGDEQSIENDLSTYSSHLLNMKFFTKNANDKTLILIDEFGTGTEPTIGGAIAEAVLNSLNNKKVFGVITTHYTNLKHFASSAQGIVNGAMLFDTNLMQPLFQLEMGKPGSSFAFEIARKIGLSEEILQEATEKVGSDYISFDKQLRIVARDKRYWEQKRLKIRQEEKQLEEVLAKYANELQTAEQLRKGIIDKAKTEAKELLAGTNKQIENTIRVIKEANAEKESTHQVRKELDEFKNKVLELPSDEEERINRKIEQLRQRGEKQRKKVATGGETPTIPEITKNENDKIIRKGDKVKLIGQDSIGEVMEVNEKNVYVAVGSMITTLPHKKLEKISNNEYKSLEKNPYRKSSPVSEDLSNRKLNFRPQIDVRGMRAEEALPLVTQFIDEAVMVDVKEVRILHGKGYGILRQLIRDYLDALGFIESFRDEQVEMGGSGITVVRIS
jgi:DNA mismatch repair protein MutS2